MGVKKVEDIIKKLEAALALAIDELDAKGLHIERISISSEREYNPFEGASIPPRKDHYKRKISINLTTDVPNYLNY